MTDALKTYRVSIPSVALGVMALRLAYSRRGVTGPYPGWTPLRRQHCSQATPIGLDYYRTIDRISRGEQP